MDIELGGERKEEQCSNHSIQEALSELCPFRCRTVFDPATNRAVFATDDGSVFTSISQLFEHYRIGTGEGRKECPTPSTRQAMDAYDETASIIQYKGSFGETASGCRDSRSNRRQIREALDTLYSRFISEVHSNLLFYQPHSIKTSLDVLNLGCGRGQDYTPFSSQPGVLNSGVWLDISEDSLRISSERAGPLRSRIVYISGDMTTPETWGLIESVRSNGCTFDRRAHGFDVVVSTLAIHYGMASREDTSRTLERMKAVCRDGARVMLTFMSEHHCKYALESVMHKERPHSASRHTWKSEDGYVRMGFGREEGAKRVEFTAGCSVLGVEEHVIQLGSLKELAHLCGWKVESSSPLGSRWPANLYWSVCLSLCS